jgi:hypothetical protein
LLLLLLLATLNPITGARVNREEGFGEGSLVSTKDDDNKAFASKANRHGNGDLGNLFRRARDAAFRGGISAFLAGAVEVIALMWLRTTMNYQYRYGVALNVAIMELYKQGGVRRFYRGLPYALLQGPLSKFGSVAANEAAVVFAKYISTQPSSSLSSALGSVMAGFWRMFLMPIDTCKTISQVDGAKGLVILGQRLMRGDIAALYSGVTATVIMASAAHYPWFLVHNFMERNITKAKSTWVLVLRSALIGFCATAVADTVSNFMRVIKTVKQATVGEQMGHVTYVSIVEKIYSESGLIGLFGRGLQTRIITDGIQNMLFTVLWKLIARKRAGSRTTTADDDNGVHSGSSAIPNEDSPLASEHVEGSNLRGTGRMEEGEGDSGVYPLDDIQEVAKHLSEEDKLAAAEELQMPEIGIELP